MIKALLKKQLLEVFSFLFIDNKRTRRTGKRFVGFLLLYALLFAYVGGAVFMMAKTLCEALVPMGLTWFYFALMALVSMVVGVVGSVFNTYGSLYLAKDNDTLLAMPIAPRAILLARLSGVYVSGLFFELIVLLPAILAWFVYGEPTALGAVFVLLIPFVLAFFVLSISCLLGLLVAVISARLRHKNAVVLVLALGFLALYAWGYSKLLSSLADLLAVVGDIAEKAKGPLFPLYHMGRAAEGEALSMLIFAGVVLGIFAVLFVALSGSFLTLATTNRGVARRTYHRRDAAQRSVGKALLAKEWKRLISSPAYLLNAGLGALMLPAAGIAMLVFREDITTMIPMIAPLLGEDEGTVALALAAMACMLSSTVYITAPSISLEGKTLWILRSLPVSPREVLFGKCKLHLIIALPAVLVAVVCMLAVFDVPTAFLFLIPLAAALFTTLVALFGLFVNLKLPNLTWTSETMVVKQSMSVMLTLFGGWGATAALGVLYVLVRDVVAASLYLSLVCLLLALANAVLYRWLCRHGTEIFTRL